MREAGLTKQERHLLALLRVWLVVFLGAGILFAAAPDWTLDYIHKLGSGLFGWKSPQLQPNAERFWLVLSVSLMATLTYLTYKAQSNLPRYISYTSVILIAKLVSTTGFAVCFFTAERSFLYLTGAIVDGLIFFITFVLYRSALRSRPRI